MNASPSSQLRRLFASLSVGLLAASTFSVQARTLLRRSLTILLTSLALWAAPNTTFAALASGDIAIIGFNSDTAVDEMTIVALAPIAAGEVIYFSDFYWDATNNRFGNDGNNGTTLNATEGIITWTPASAIAAGTVIKFTITQGTPATVAGLPGTVSASGWSTGVTASGGDNWFIYQGASGSAPSNWIFGWANWPSPASPTFAWLSSNLISGTTSMLPSGLTNGTNAIALTGATVTNVTPQNPHFDNNVYTATKTGTKASLLTAICTGSNWIGDEITAYDIAAGGTRFPGTNPIFILGAPSTTISSLNRNDVSPNRTGTVNWTLTFASAVTGVTASNFSLTGAAATGATVGSPTSGSGGVSWSVPVTTGSTDGTLTLNLANSTGITPGISTALPYAGQSYTMDKTAPTISIGAPSQSSIVAGAGSVTYTVTYADTNFGISVLANGNITLNTTGTASGTVGVSGSGLTRTVTISSITGAGTLGISIAASTANDTAGNVAPAAGPSTTFAVLSNNADLSALALTTATINEVFAAATTSYTSSVPNATSSVTVTPTAAQANATIQARVGANAFASITSGSPSAALPLAVGANTIEVKVTAQDGTTIKTYAITVTRAAAAGGGYTETFSTQDKGYKLNFIDDFTGVNWTLSPWATGGGERDATDYFATTAAGKLESLDLDQAVYWESPLLSISDPGTVTLGVDLVWVGFDSDGTLNNLITDWIKVEYSVNGGAYQMAPNVHGGNPLATVAYPFENPGTTNNSSSATVNVAGIVGSTLKIRITVATSQNSELVTIDNVSVPQAGVFVIGKPTVTTASSASVTGTTATLGGNVTLDGGASLTARGVVYSQTSLNANPQIGGANVTNLVHGSATTGIFTVNASSLTAATQYSFAAYATNSYGTTYTTPVSTFTTSAGAPAITGTMMFTQNTGLGDGIAQDGEAGSSDIPGITMQVFNITDTAGTLFPSLSWQNNAFFSSGDTGYSALTYDQNAGTKGMAIKSSDGSEFQLNQFLYYNWGESFSTTITVKGYRNAVEVASTTFAGYVNTAFMPITVNLDNTFDNVDDVRLYISAGGYQLDQSATNHSINNIVIAPPVAAPTAPEIAVTESAANVADGGSLSFGTTTVGTPVTKTFTVTNSGTATLNLSALTLPSGFTSAGFVSSTVAASGGTTTFQVTMTAAAAATPTGTLSFTTNDADEGSYDFTISGTVNPAPDTTPPVISGTPANITNVEATSPAGAVVTYTSPTALDVVDGPRPVNCVLPSGSTFAIGVNTVVCTATDLSANSASTSFTVTVVDTTPPVIMNTPANITGVVATGPAGAVVTYTSPTAMDIVDGAVPVSCVLPSGSTFAIGLNTVVCTAVDVHGNSASTSFTINVLPQPVPEIAVRGNGNPIPDGSLLAAASTTNATDFGSTPVAGGVVEITYTIANIGDAALNLTGGPNFVSVSPATDFSVTQQPTSPVPATIGTTTFKIAFNPTTAATTSATVTFTNDDADEASFDFVIKGTGTGPQTFDLVGHPVSNTPFDGGETYIYSAGPPPPQPINSAVGDVVSGGGAPNATGADSGADFDVLKRGGFLSENGTLTFPGNLLVGSGFPAVTLSNFRGLWKDNGTGLKLIARTGDIAPGTTTDTFSGLPDIPGISDNGDVTILGALTVAGGTTASNDTGLWTQVGSGTTPSTFNLLAREGSVVPGTSAVVRKFASGAYATASFSTTQGVVAYSVTTVGSPDKTAIYSTTVDNGVPTSSTALAIEGNPAPGVAGQTFGPLASSYSDPARMDTAGNVAFAAILKPSNKESLWYAPYSTGVATKIFAAGDVAPDTGGATFLNLKSQALGGTGTITFRGFLTSNTGDNTGNLKNDGIWRGTGSNVGTYTCILRRGDNNATRPGLNLPNAADKVGNLWHSWLTNANHGAWVGQLDAGGDGTSVPAPGDTYGIYTDLSGTMTLYMLYGDPAPGIPGAVMDTVDLPIVGGQEQMVFIGKVTGGGVSAGMNDQGIWRSAPNGGALSLLIRTGDSMTTTAGVKTIAKVDFPGSGSKARQWEQPVMDSTGRVLIFVTFIDGSTSQVIAP